MLSGFDLKKIIAVVIYIWLFPRKGVLCFMNRNYVLIA